MKLVILDSGLRAKNGHHYNLDRCLKKIAESQNIECVIYGNRTCQSEILESLDCQAYFHYECYFQFKTIAIDKKISSFVILNNQIFRELSELPVSLISSDNLFLFHTVTERHLEGILRWLDSFPQASAPQVVIFLMLPSGLKYRNGKLSVYDCLTASLYHYALNKTIKQRKNLHFYGSGEAHSGDYSWLLGETISSHPMFLGSAEKNDRYFSFINLPEEKNIILYLGDAKSSKGFHYLPEIYQICSRQLPEYNFIVHINGPEINYNPLNSVAKTLSKIAEKNSNLIILDGFLDTGKYYYCIESADLLVIPYDPVVYADKSSGILWESLYYGKPVVIPKNSWLEYEAKKEGHAFIAFEEYEAESIANAISNCVKVLAEKKSLAQSISQDYRKREGIEAVWNLLTEPQLKQESNIDFIQGFSVTGVCFVDHNEDVTPFNRVINHGQHRQFLADYRKDAIIFCLDSFISISLPGISEQADKLYLKGKLTEKVRGSIQASELPKISLNGWCLEGKFQVLDDGWEYQATLNLHKELTGQAGEIIIDLAGRRPELILLIFPSSGEDILARALNADPKIEAGSLLPWWRLDGEHLAALYHNNHQFIQEDWDYISQRTIAFARHSFYQQTQNKENWIEIYADYQVDLSLLVKMFPRARIACLVTDGRSLVANLTDNENQDWKNHFFAHYNEQPNQTNLLKAWCQWHNQLIVDASKLGVQIHYIKLSNLLQLPQQTLEKLYYFFDLPIEAIDSASIDCLTTQKFLGEGTKKKLACPDKQLMAETEFLLNKLGISDNSPVLENFQWQVLSQGETRESEKLTIYLLRTPYPHFSENTGPQHFIKHFDYSSLNVIEYAMPIGNHIADSQLSPKGRNNLKILVKEQGFNAYSLNNLMAELKVFKDLVQNSFNVDVIHYLDGEHGMQYLPVLLQKYQLKNKTPKIIVTYHQSPDLLKDFIVPEILAKVDGIHVLASNQYDYFSSFMPKEKLFLIPHGVAVDFFTPRTYPIREDGKTHCITVGTWQRDYETVYQVAETLLNSSIVFNIVSQKEIENFAQQPPNVTVYSGLSDKELLALYHQSDLLFLPLKDATANNAILEALACGLPIVASDLQAVRNYVPEEASYLVKNNDVESFKQAIVTLAQNPHGRKRMGKIARATAERLAWANIAKEMQNMYRQVVLNPT
jgi:glycosyltransferase involved in cell wall biosynthesis